MKRGDERRQFAFGHILQLVDEEHEGGVSLSGGGSRQVDQVDQIGVEIAIVRDPNLPQIERRLQLTVTGVTSRFVRQTTIWQT